MGQGRTATRNDAFFNGRLGGVDGIFQAQLLVLHLGLGGGAHLDHGHTTAQFGQTFLQLLLVIGGVGFVHLLANLLTAGLYRRLIAFGNDGGGVFVDGDATGRAEHLDLGVLQLETGIFGDQLAVSQHRDVFEHGLAAIAETRGLDCGYVQYTAQAIDHQGGQGFFLDVLSDDQQGFAGTGDLFENGDQILHQANFLVGDQDVGIIQHRLHALGIGGEVRGDVALVEAHPFGDFEFGGHRFAFFEGDDALLAHFVHGVGNHPTHFFVVTGGNGAHLGDGNAVADWLGVLLNLAHQEFGGLVDTTLQGDGIGAGSHVAQTCLDHGVGQDRGGGGAVTGGIIGFAGGLADQGNTGVFDVVFEFDLLGDGDTVIDDLGSAEFLLEYHVATLRTKGDGNGLGQDVDAPFKGTAGLFVVNNAFCHFK